MWRMWKLIIADKFVEKLGLIALILECPELEICLDYAIRMGYVLDLRTENCWFERWHLYLYKPYHEELSRRRPMYTVLDHTEGNDPYKCTKDMVKLIFRKMNVSSLPELKLKLDMINPSTGL